MSQPIKIQWPARGHDRTAENGTSPATLIIRVETGFALEMQHLAPVIIERVNAHFGWRGIARVLLKQGPIEARPAARPVIRPPGESAEAAAEKLVGHILADHDLESREHEEPLRLALTRLGARVLSHSGEFSSETETGSR